MSGATSSTFRALHDANHGRVTRILARLVGPQEAEDLAQVVFVKAAKALPKFGAEASPKDHCGAVRFLSQRVLVQAGVARLLPGGPGRDAVRSLNGIHHL